MNIINESVYIPLHFSAQEHALLNSLQQKSRNLAKIYLGAILILKIESHPDRIALSAHGFRELIEKIPEHFNSAVKLQTPSLKEKVNELFKNWGAVCKHSECHKNQTWNGQIDSHLKKFLEKVSHFFSWIEQSNPNRRTMINKMLYELDPMKRSLPKPISKLRIEMWGAIRDFFVKVAHHRGDDNDIKSFIEWKDYLERFVIDIVSPRTFDDITSIDAIIAEGEKLISLELVKKTLKSIKRFSDHEYFFMKIESPDWIKPLWSEGMFQDPPDPIKHGNSIQFPNWSESRYLLRMSPKEPTLVMDVILHVPDKGNIRVYEDFLDAALKMSPKISVKLIEKAKTWIRTSHAYHRLPELVADFVVHLSKGGFANDAFDLATVLLEIKSASGDDEKKEATREELIKEVRLHCETWVYEQNLKKCIPELLDKLGFRVFELLCTLLDNAICLTLGSIEKRGSNDSSYMWRPAIEDHEQNTRQYEIKKILVSQVRDSAKSLIEKDKKFAIKIIQCLESKCWNIFRRIALYLMTEFPDYMADFIENRLTDRSLFEDIHIRYEYSKLLNKRFGKLSPEGQKTIIGWINKGPDIESFKKGCQEEIGREPAYEDILKYKKIWRRDWLSFLLDGLPEKLEEEYEELVKELGHPEHPELLYYFTMWNGPQSPINEDELAKKTVDEIVDFVRNWRPPGGFFSSTPEGLGRTLSNLISGSPQKFAEEATKFIRLDPTYVRALLTGLWDALKKKLSFDWENVLKVCKWVLDQPVEIPGRKPDPMENQDPDWRWSRKAIADLLSDGFGVKEGTIPIEFKEQAWNILKILTEDSEPSVEYEKKYGGGNMDPFSIAINTTRGEAMQALVKFALWIRQDLEKRPNATDLLERGLDEMPDVREVLERHLDTAIEPSLAIRSVYGRWFPWLVLIDQNWAQKHVSDIFPEDTQPSKLCFSAWDAYVIFNTVFDNVFEVLKKKYLYMVDHLGVSRDWKETPNADEMLAHHLMILYWRSKLDLNEADGPLQIFWKKASPKLRGQAIGYVGHSLKNTEGVVNDKFLSRLMVLWNSRLEAAAQANNREDCKSEIMAFGWWFISEKFDNKWSVKELQEALKIAGSVEMEHLVVERLAELAKELPIEVINCVEQITECLVKGWAIFGVIDHLRAILTEGLKTGAVEKSKEIIDHLLSLGHFDFRDLLQGRET